MSLMSFLREKIFGRKQSTHVQLPNPKLVAGFGKPKRTGTVGVPGAFGQGPYARSMDPQ